MAQRKRPKFSSKEIAFFERFLAETSFRTEHSDDKGRGIVKGLDFFDPWDFDARFNYDRRKALMVDLANLTGDMKAWEWFYNRWRKWVMFYPPGEFPQLVEELREIWRQSETASSDRSNVTIAQAILDRWLAYKPEEATIKRWTDQEEHLGCLNPLRYPYSSVCTSLSSGHVVPSSSSLHGWLIQGVLDHWGYFRTCANQDCAALYFIAKRKDQTVCDAEKCKADKQRQHALKWWQENRAKSKAGTGQGSSKGTRKGSSKNVSPKTR